VRALCLQTSSKRGVRIAAAVNRGSGGDGDAAINGPPPPSSLLPPAERGERASERPVLSCSSPAWPASPAGYSSSLSVALIGRDVGTGAWRIIIMTYLLTYLLDARSQHAN